VDDRIYRCSDGHLYAAETVKSILLSAHLGLGRHFERCPVDGRWRLAKRVAPDTLSEDQLAEARKTHF
jgi:hypothetical protein